MISNYACPTRVFRDRAFHEHRRHLVCSHLHFPQLCIDRPGWLQFTPHEGDRTHYQCSYCKRTIQHPAPDQCGSNLPFAHSDSCQGQMRAEGFRLAKKTQVVTGLLDRAMDLSHSPRLCPPLPGFRWPDPQNARAVGTRKSAESFKRHIYNAVTVKRLPKRNAERIDQLLIHIANEFDGQM